MIGGGEGSQIGPVHRLAACLDNRFELAAGALDVDAEAGQKFARSLGIAADRGYANWEAMLAAERARPDRLDLVTIATPNSTHFSITRGFLKAGVNVLCEKPMTMTVEEGEEIVRLSRETGVICAVNYGYTGYPMVRQMRAMIEHGDLGRVRLIKAEFAHGHHADAEDANNPRVRWRYDPAQAGVSAVMSDCGIHALHMASFVTGQHAETLSADFVSCVAPRVLEDDAMINLRMSDGAVCRLWTSAISVGRQHGLTMQIFGEKGGLRWSQEQPNQLYWTPLNSRTEVIERGAHGLSPEAEAASRVAVGHAEGMPLAFANIYRELADMISAQTNGAPTASTLCPTAEDGLRSTAAVHAAAQSAKLNGAWIDARPPMFRRT
ncbi:MAG: Gfo/Idh/MocA family oxidoreductase [Salinisphaera sp.]|nr:Gfo/Idh/MocA family oxidoreductase [Salinisphaera sp.]